MDIKMKVGLRIKELRTQKSITQEGLAWKAEINRTFMNQVENGGRTVSIAILEKIIEALGVSFQEFFNAKDFVKDAE
jgi:transcriptional regulator with XRE-family HTH domain